MTPRCFIDPAQRHGGVISLNRDLSHYLTQVLRLKPGDQLIVLDNSGIEFVAQLETSARAGLRCRILEERPSLAEPDLDVTLVQGLPKGEKFEGIVQKATELGVRRIIPLLCDHSLVRWHCERAEGKMARWRAISREAAEQSERGRIPAISAPVSWTDLWRQLPEDATFLCFHARGGIPVLQALARIGAELGTMMTPHPNPLPEGEGISSSPPSAHQVEQGHKPRRVAPLTLLIGPEGGWSEQELADLIDRHIPLVSQGRRVLRTETAAIAAIATVMTVLEAVSGP